ncbi:DUF317 domain-containing protein, partial [Kitasatospora sp. NPDC001574]
GGPLPRQATAPRHRLLRPAAGEPTPAQQPRRGILKPTHATVLTALAPLADGTAAGRQMVLPDTISYIEPVHGLARVDHELPGRHHAFQRDGWFIAAGHLHLGRPREGWYMEMSARIPPSLLAAVTGALVDRTPVQRPRTSLADDHLPHLDITAVPADRPSPALRAGAARTSTAGSVHRPPAFARTAPGPTVPKVRGR